MRRTGLVVLFSVLSTLSCGNDESEGTIVQGTPSGGAAGSAATSGSAGSAASSGSAGSSGTAGSAGASGSSGSSGNGGTGATSIAPDALTFVTPAEAAIYPQTGYPFAAQIPFEVEAGSDIVEVEYLVENAFSLGTSSDAPSFATTFPFKVAGQRTAYARGYDTSHAVVAETQVSFNVEAPASMTCLETLDWLGLDTTPTEARGVVDAVNVNGLINGVLFANGTSTDPSGDPMACEFVKTLWTFATLLKERGFERVGTLGSYCYRCCCAWSATNYCRGPNDPEPDCSANGYSNHSWGRAVDVRYLYKTNGDIYDINSNDDFAMFTSQDTCGAGLAAQTGVSAELYSLACEASSREIFGTILTPNHNDAHRNHFHMDIGKSGTPSSYIVE